MKFEDIFREKYRVALHAARADDVDATIAGLNDLYCLLSSRLEKGEDSFQVKAKLSYWVENFRMYVEIVRTNGLRDKKIQRLFGLIDETGVPSLGDLFGKPKEVSSSEKEDVPWKDKSSEKIRLENPLPIGESALPVHDRPGQKEEPELPKSDVKPVFVESASGGGKDGPAFEPDSLDEFIGQQHIVKPILKEIAIAKAQGRNYIDNILLFGNPGLGKTTLMGLIAKSLGARFEKLDCSQQTSPTAMQSFLMRIAREGVPVVIAFDEVHRLSDSMQEGLLTLLQNRVYVSPPDRKTGSVKRIAIENFTFIAATTDEHKIKDTIRDRCSRLTFHMVDYSPEDLKRIFRNKSAARGLTMTDDAIDVCIPRVKGSLRYVSDLVKDLDNALYDDLGNRISSTVTPEVVNKYFDEKHIDENGLGLKDVEILNSIAESPNGCISAKSIAARVGINNVDNYLTGFEPYLIKIGFVVVTSKGRSLTEKGREYLARKAQNPIN